ncbi:MAG: FAD-binding protein [Gemmatimonadaceae bacterium]
MTSPVAVTSLAALQQAVSDAYRARTPLRISAGRHWLDAGRTVHASAELHVGGVSGVVEYSPGDFTLAALTGTTLAELDAVTHEHGQWVTLDPFGSRHGTLGATLATASAGPLAATVGAPRDVTLGVTFVNGEGQVIHGGGRVVKNVAGFDLVRLTIGAWGSLGVIGEATIRVRARPQVDRTIRLELPTSAADWASLFLAIRQAPATPLAVQVVNAPLGARLGLGAAHCVLIRLAGNRASVTAQQDALHGIARIEEVPDTIWNLLTASDPQHARSLRLSAEPTALARSWQDLDHRFGGDDVSMSACVLRGVTRLVASPTRDEHLSEWIRQRPQHLTAVGERLPSQLWALLPAPTNALSVGIRRALDPAGILNPGILGIGPA